MSADNKKFTIAFTISGGFLASFGPFIVPYLTDIGYSPSKIAFLLFIYNVGIIFSFPIIGFLNDNYITMKNSILALIIISILTTTVYLFLPETYSVIFVYLLMLSVFQRPIFGILETYTTKMSQLYSDIDFGIPRSFSSLGYALISVLAGTVATSFGYEALMIGQIFFLLVFFISILFLKNYPLQKDLEEPEYDVVPKELPEQNNFKNAVYDLVRNKNYILLVFYASFFMISYVGFTTYLPMLITSAGGGTKELGICLSIMALCEVPVMFFYKAINRRFSLNSLLVFCISMNIIKMLLPVIFPTLTVIYFSQILQAFTFAIFIPSIYLAIYQSVKPKNSSFGISIAITIYSSICSTLTVYFSGVLLESITIYNLLTIFALSSTMSLIIIVFKIMLNKKEKANERA